MVTDRRKPRRTAPAAAPEPVLSDELRQVAEAAAQATAGLENHEALPAIRAAVRRHATSNKMLGVLIREAWQCRLAITGTRRMLKLERRLAAAERRAAEAAAD